MRTQTSTGSCLFALSTLVACASLTWQPMSSLWYVSKHSLLATKLELHTSPDRWTIEHLLLIHLALLDLLMINNLTVLIFALKFTTCVLCVATADGVPE